MFEAVALAQQAKVSNHFRKANIKKVYVIYEL